MGVTRGTNTEQQIVVVGQGYVGLPLAVRAVEVGHTVVGFDVDTERVKRLTAGESFVEDVTSERLAAALATGRYHATADPRQCAGFDVGVITVPTPLREGLPDLTYIEEAARRSAPVHCGPGATVVLESTTYPGTTEELVAAAPRGRIRPRAPGEDFHLGYSPERIDPGNAVWTFENTPKVVSGVDARRRSPRSRPSTTRSSTTTVPVASTQVAELTKLLENTFRHVNIALVNELAMFARELGIDVWEAIDAASHASPSASCVSRRAPASAVTACRSTPPTCRGG